MASRKKQISIPAPNTGVRKDVNELVQDGSMAGDASNVMFLDGTIRPRPAMDPEVTPVGISNYQQLLDMYEHPDKNVTNEAIRAIVQADDGSFILGASESGTWWMSGDNGSTWSVPSLNWPIIAGAATDNLIHHLHIEDGYLWAFVSAAYVGPGNYYYYLFRAPITIDGTPPSSLTWTNVLQTSVLWAGAASDIVNEFKYDSDTGKWLIIYNVQATYGIPYLTYYKPEITVIDDPDGTASQYTLGGGIYSNSGGFLKPNARWVHGKYLVVTSGFYWYAYWDIRQEGITCSTLEYNSTSGLYEYTWDTGFLECFYTNPQDPPISRNPYNHPDVGVGRPHPTIDGITSVGSDDERIAFFWAVADDSDSSLDAQWIMVASFDGTGGFTTPATVKHTMNTKASRYYVRDSDYTTEKTVFIFYDYTVGSTVMPDVAVTSDSGNTWQEFEGEDTPLTHSIYGEFLYFNDSTDQHFLVTKTDILPENDEKSEVWLLPSSAGSSKFGKFHDMAQFNMDDGDDQIIVGTTRAVLKLDTTTGQFRRITADQSQCSPSGDFGGPWNLNATDIPPLSADPSADEYQSGVTIDAVYGENPWTFRTFLSNGKTFLLGTNGQSYPICYHNEMAGGLARRLGEVPEGDPNDYTISAEDISVGWLQRGNLAPRARCMAVAANRVLLANNPTGSPYEVFTGGFNDCDRGWGSPDSQLVLLGDTPGSIVTMQEINALQVAIYKEDAIYHAVAQNEFGGVVAPFRFEMSKSGIAGPCSPASVLRNHDGRQIYLARDGGVYMYDGVAPIDGGRNIRRMIQNDIDYDQLGRVWGMIDPQRKLAWFFYPSKDGLVNKGIVISTDQGYPWPTWPIKLPTGWNFTCGSKVSITDDVTIGDLGEFGTYNEETLSSFSTGDLAMLTGSETGVFYSQKWDDDGNYTDGGAEINILLRTGWTTPGGVGITSADELYHIFSSPSPEQELEVRLRAQKIGQNIIERGPRALYAGKPRRRTRHRVGGMQFAVDLRGSINRIFNWGGATLTGSSGGRNRG